ncbi:unnamed protein product [Rhodiola kirilowii]
MATGTVVKGSWSEEEDEKLLSYITKYGHGHWEVLARKAGLNRTGKSCRLRWLNYLRPGIRRGNITLHEQLIILQLHARWGNRWAKIAECLPGRSDNEIKNYWRTRVQRQAKQLHCEPNSHQFREIMHHVWMPQLAERVQLQPSPIIIQEYNCLPLISADTLPNNSKALSPSNTSTHGHNDDGGDHTHQPIDCEKRIIPCDENFSWSKQGLGAAGNKRDDHEIQSTAWCDHDNYSVLDNLLNDEDMILLCQQLLNDHQP